MNILIEKASKNDIPRLNELYKDLTGEISCLVKMEDEFEKFIHNKDYYLLVVKLNGYIIGTGLGIVFRSLAANCRPYFVIDNIIIDKNFRGNGYGTLLFNKFYEYIKMQNCRYSYLIANANNYKAHMFYKKIGYTDEIIGFQKSF